MKKTVAYGVTAVVALVLVSAAVTASLYSVYSPVAKENVPIDRVSMKQLKSWLQTPSFSRWNDMSDVKQYLEKHGVEYEGVRSEDTRQNLVAEGDGKQVIRNYVSQELSSDAVTKFECSEEDREVEFTLTNTGKTNWFLVDQELTRDTNSIKKYLSSSLLQAKKIDFYINGYLVNGGRSNYQNGQRLFFDQDETFGVACQADFLRRGRSVECELQPVPLRGKGGFIPNSYSLNGPGFQESGTFTCA